jgi:DeoR family ulaG and ulaABCDEF operon transcriptional repressor
VLSPFSNDTIENFWGNKLFTGCYGLNRFGIMEADPLVVQAQTKLLKRTEDVIVMADSSKLRQKSAMIVTGLDRISTIVTDDGAKPEELDVFKAAGIKVIVASVSSQDEFQKLA